MLLGLFLLALVPRLIILAVSGARAIETWEYETLARSIAAGHGYSIAHFGRTAFAFGDGNLYSFLAGATYTLIGHQPMILAIAQAAAASLAAPVIFAIGSRALGTPTALVGAALAAVHPGHLAYTLKLHPLGLDVLLLSMMVLWVGALGTRTRDGLIAGVALGLTLMTRPTFFLAGVVALAVRNRRLVLAQLAPAVVAVSLAVVIATPWIARNWLILGKPIFISTSFEDVWKGNNPFASGSSYLASGDEVFTMMSPRMRTRMSTASELELNDVFADEVIAFITEQPGEFASLFARKFLYFWWFSPQSGLFYPAQWLTAYQVYDAIVLSLAVAGSVAIVRTGSPEAKRLLWMLLWISLTITLIHALAYVEGRHRWGIEPLLLLLTAQGVFAVAPYLRVRVRATST